MKEFNFDMDGTIADLYGVSEWLADLRAEKVRPYAEARPLVNMSRLARALNKAKRCGATLRVISWTSKGGSKAYNEAVAEVKKVWLKRHLPSVKWDEIAVVPYGTPKSTLGNGILFDDEERNRAEWGEGAHSPEKMFEVLAAV